MKLYTGFVNDHTGSMSGVAKAALKDSNVLVRTIKDSATNEQLDSIVSVVGLGLQSNTGFPLVRREVVISNPHVLKERTSWPTPGGNSPLWDAIFEIIALHESLPDATDPNVSFCIFITTDGQQGGSNTKLQVLADKIRALQSTGRWTFVARVPTGGIRYLDGSGIPYGNIQEWDTTVAGMERSTVQTQSAVTSFMRAKSTGTNSSSSFYTNTAAVDTSKLTDITSEVSLYQVPDSGNTARLRIDDFILGRRSKFLKGAAFVQLVKTEAKIGPKKIVLIRERKAPFRIFAGKEARQMVNMPTDPTSNARLNPGEHGDYDIFIQSESLNRLLPDKVGVIYWEKQGVPFTQADIDLFTAKPAAAPAAPVLPAVVGRTKPTPSPVPKAAPVVTDTINGRPVKFFLKRDDARDYARANKLPKGSLGDVDTLAGHLYPTGHAGKGRWFVYTA